MNSQELLRELIDKSLSGYVYDMAAVVRAVYKDKYVCSKIKSRQWFTFDDLKWCYTEIGPYHDISIHFVSMYDTLLSDELDKSQVLERQLSMYDTESQEIGSGSGSGSGSGHLSVLQRSLQNDLELCKKRTARLDALISKLKNVTFKEAVCREAMYLFYNPDFLGKLDRDRHLICFRNGILNMQTREFRQGLRQDYVSLYVDDDYMTPLTAGDIQFQQKIDKFMTFRENIIAKRKGSQFKFTVGDLST